jgi:hypothetical protein
MAIDTRDKRDSAIHVGLPWRMRFPVPDGSLPGADRQHAAFLYRGIAVSTGALSVHQQCIDGIHADILTLSLDGISSANVLKRKIPRGAELDDLDDSINDGIIVSTLPNHGYQKFPQHSTNERTAWGFPVLLTGWSFENQDNAIDSGSDEQFLRMQTLMQRYDEQRLSGVATIHFCRVTPLNVLDMQDFLGNVWSWHLRVDCITRLAAV